MAVKKYGRGGYLMSQSVAARIDNKKIPVHRYVIKRRLFLAVLSEFDSFCHAHKVLEAYGVPISGRSAYIERVARALLFASAKAVERSERKGGRTNLAQRALAKELEEILGGGRTLQVWGPKPNGSMSPFCKAVQAACRCVGLGDLDNPRPLIYKARERYKTDWQVL